MLCVVLGSVIAGCETPDERLTEFVSSATSEQAQQNREIADVARTAAENHRLVVEAVEKSRQEVTSLQRDVRQELQKLDEERRTLAHARWQESLLAPVITNLGLLLIAALPLALCWYLLHGLASHGNEDAVCDVLIQQLVEEPLPNLPAPTLAGGIEHSITPETPTTDDPAD